MKSGTQNHVKTKRLKRLLGIPLYQVVGLLETMWQLCMEVCEEGNIGKFTDEEIADYLEWDGDPKKLVTSLAEAGWLDLDDEFRYVVHDWLEECPEFIWDRIRKRRQREQRVLNQRKIRTYVSSASEMSDVVPAASGTRPECPGVPNPTQPNQSKPNPTSVASDKVRETGEEPKPEPPTDYPEAFENFWKAYPPRSGRRVGKGKCLGIWKRAIRESDREPLVKAASAYAASDEAIRNFAKDPERFLEKDLWRDWLAPPERPKPPPPRAPSKPPPKFITPMGLP